MNDAMSILQREIAQALVARTQGLEIYPFRISSSKFRLWQVKTPADLEELAHQMKFDSGPDEDAPGDYSQTEQEAAEVSEDMKKVSAEEAEAITAHTRVMLYKGKIYSITLTQGLHPEFLLDGFDWHLSMCLIESTTPSRAADDVCRIVCESFFLEHQEIPNPGKMSGVRHFAGKD